MELNIFQYRFPFRSSFTTGSGSFTQREGLFLQLENEGIRACGEAAPLPGFSPESLDELITFTRANASQIKALVNHRIKADSLEWKVPSLPLPASLGFALDTLTADFHSKRQQRPVQQLLFDRFAPQLPVNATLPVGDLESSLTQAQEYWQQGYRTLKLKVGRNFDRERTLIQHLRNHLPQAKLRIDANQSWFVDEAIANLQALEECNIEYCEEPISDPTSATLRQVNGTTNIPIAIDESLYKQSNHNDWIADDVADILILKPMILGTFSKIFETCRVADDHDYTIIFTSALETGLGRWMTAVLASGLGNSETAHGLATGQLLAMDVWKDQHYIENGTLKLPDGPGFTVELPQVNSDSTLNKLDIF